MDQKVRNKRSNQLFAPTRILLDNIEAGHKHLELVSYREEMKQYASDEEYTAFLVKPSKAQKVKKRAALKVPKIEAQEEPEQAEESAQEEQPEDPMAILLENLQKKPRNALIKEAEAAKIKVSPDQSNESIISAICQLYRI